ncbi:MAG: DNA (cytosine-5-)-methyltransferase [Methylococcales symbiont of Hymedesmia sp. n. MRB-2018]|nr:MAG: DNA (cytosine-5-)-methyltransferase [Methylococcales symbiont of Hymedesmia sp. n. MRB-2018]
MSFVNADEEIGGKYFVGSLFAGVGGIDEAFKSAGCDVLWANEIDKNACETYKANNSHATLFECDIKDLHHRELPSIDILTAGFPCQSFSHAGHSKGFDDERGKLFFEVPKLLAKLKPKAYLLENVRALATHDKGNSLDIVKNEILKAGYLFILFVLRGLSITQQVRMNFVIMHHAKIILNTVQPFLFNR